MILNDPLLLIAIVIVVAFLAVGIFFAMRKDSDGHSDRPSPKRGSSASLRDSHDVGERRTTLPADAESTPSAARPAPAHATDKILRSIDGSLSEIAASMGSIKNVLERAEGLLAKANMPSGANRSASRPPMDHVSSAEPSLAAASSDLIFPPPTEPLISDDEVLRLGNRLIETRGSYRGRELTEFRVITRTPAGFTLGGPALGSPDSDLIGQRSFGMNVIVIPGFLVAKNAGTRVNPLLSGDLGVMFEYQRGEGYRLLSCALLTGDSSLLQSHRRGVIEGPSHSDL
jgi:hypothetical protein